MYIADDLEGDPRWPTYGPRAASIGIRAQLGVDLHHPAGARASLNLYARNPGALGSVADDADLFAGHAALVLGYATATDHFQAALASRRAIGQALGIVMERYRIDEDRAFRFLTRVSQESNVKLREVAAEIVAGANRRNQPRRDGAESHESADADQ